MELGGSSFGSCPVAYICIGGDETMNHWVQLPESSYDFRMAL
jgi:hypothetical protein